MFWNNIKVNKINKERIPKKHRNLLNHEDVMTLVLEKFYKQNMDVRVLESNITTNNNYLREIFLVGRIDKKIKEIAHIEIHLDNLPKEVIKEILNEKISFGKLLLKYNIYTTRKLLYFFKVRKSELMKYYNIETKSNFLYGRKYIIKTEGNKVLARVIEILK